MPPARRGRSAQPSWSERSSEEVAVHAPAGLRLNQSSILYSDHYTGGDIVGLSDYSGQLNDIWTGLKVLFQEFSILAYSVL
jgi:hypothetical protein